MSFISNAALLVLAVAVTGCSVAPKIELSKITKPESLRGDEIDSYYLQRSTIKIEQSGTTKNADGKEVVALAISSIPEEYTNLKLGVRRADSIGIRTNLNITKFANTDLIKEAGVDVVDNRIDTINKAGTILKTLAPFVFDASKGTSPEALPKRINTLVLLEQYSVGREEKKGVDAADGVTIDFGVLPPDARPLESYGDSTALSGLVYAACRQAVVKLKYQGNSVEQSVRISDPRYLQIASFPIKGKISFHSECGVSILSEKDTGVSTNAAVVDALVVQGKAIKEAIEAAKKDGK